MAAFRIITDSSCDLSAAEQKKLDITVIPLSLTMEGREYLNTEDERGISAPALYNELRAGKTATTSAANIGTFLEYFEPILQAGEDLVYIGFSSALSGTYSASVNAANDLREKYPERKIFTVDSLCASLGQGLYVYHLVQKKNAGATIEELVEYAEAIKLNIAHWFTVDDLQFLHRGGRVSAASAFFGTVLNIKPVMHVDDEGRLVPVSKVRGRKASIRAIAQNITSTVKPFEGQTVFICHGDCMDDAQLLKSTIEEMSDLTVSLIDYTGPVIGSHSGPGTLAAFAVTEKR